MQAGAQSGEVVPLTTRPCILLEVALFRAGLCRHPDRASHRFARLRHSAPTPLDRVAVFLNDDRARYHRVPGVGLIDCRQSPTCRPPIQPQGSRSHFLGPQPAYWKAYGNSAWRRETAKLRKEEARCQGRPTPDREKRRLARKERGPLLRSPWKTFTIVSPG